MPKRTNHPPAKKSPTANRETSPAVAAKAGKLLHSEDPDTRSVAASALAQVDEGGGHDAVTGEVLSDLEQSPVVVAKVVDDGLPTPDEVIEDLRRQLEQSTALCRKLEDDFYEMTKKDARHYAEEARLKGLLDGALDRLQLVGVGGDSRRQLDEALVEITRLKGELESQVAWAARRR
jgi:hypothetical protein